MIGALLSGLWANPKVRLGAYVVAGFVAFMAIVTAHGHAQYRKGFTEGQLRERLQWEEKYRDAQTEAREARERLNAAQAALELARQERDRARSQSRSQVQREIENATNTEDRYAAYMRFRDSLRGPTAARFARARADYLSDVSDRATGGPGSA